ncbi:retinol dehydrogenase 13-like [Neocloeon triangulifer]|uniref:retinol dehydrogenase 13-like n=1 Tax=Neocloeon triangulifer TaxID=2078957 RepID=UPI00286FA356|nr:retinol dehydrogenase 13-like [Neocloeon triangulifer]
MSKIMKVKKGLLSNKFVLATSAAGTIFAGAIFLKEYMGGKKFEGNERADDKIVIITGANTGIGKETARELAKRGARVFMACRDIHKCEEAREEIVIETKNKFVYCRQCDLASQESIRKFVQRFKNEQSRLDILINNAGVMRCPQSYTKEGIELQLGVNHMGHFLLTNLLLDLLKTSQPSRVITVSSIAHTRGQINKEDLNSKLKYDPGDAYSQSKLANVLFSKELASRLKGTGVISNSLHPGVVDTELFRHMGFFKSTTASLFVRPLMWPFVKTPKQGAQTTLFAALDESLKETSGKYFKDCAEYPVAPQGDDDSMAKWLWAVSEKWTRLDNK